MAEVYFHMMAFDLQVLQCQPFVMKENPHISKRGNKNSNKHQTKQNKTKQTYGRQSFEEKEKKKIIMIINNIQIGI